MSETVKKPTLCWTCTRPGTGGCSWDKELKPVEGWKAQSSPVLMSNKGLCESYIVEKCPLYEEDREAITQGPPSEVVLRVRERILAKLREGDTTARTAKEIGVCQKAVAYHKQRFQREGIL